MTNKEQMQPTALYQVLFRPRLFCGAAMALGSVLVVTTAAAGLGQDGGAAAPGASGVGSAQIGAKAETRITKEQGKELLRSVDQILAFVSADTKLPIRHPVKRTIVSREEVTRYLREKFKEDEGTKRLERSEIVLKKFGLLDRDFHLGPFLVTLLTEQIAGYYDNKTQTVNLLDWIQPDEQKPVLAHELTHALQDQKVGLTKWSEVSEHEVAKTVAEDNQHIRTDEAETAREAVAEGQAMISFVDYTLNAESLRTGGTPGRTLADAPELLEKFKEAASDTSGSPVLARAPLLLQESLLFPYSEGLSFEDAVLVKAGKEAAFAGVLTAPPSSTFEILHPAAYLRHDPVPALRLPDIHTLTDKDYVPYDVGVMGELDVRMLTELFAGREVAEAIGPAWNGGIYYAAQERAATGAERESTGSLALLYSSRWKTAEAASAFLRVYAGQLARKYAGVVRRVSDEADAGEQVYSTNEGDVLLSVAGNNVYVGEGFPLALSRALRDKVAAAQGFGPVRLAGVAGEPPERLHEPALEMVRGLAGFGLMRVAVGLRERDYTATGRKVCPISRSATADSVRE